MNSRGAPGWNGNPPVTQGRLREILWGIGQQAPVGVADDHVVLAAVRPRLGYLRWHVRTAAVGRLYAAIGQPFKDARLIVRLFDVTDVALAGGEAQSIFDVPLGDLSGKRYVELQQSDCTLIAEIGYRLADGAFHPLARSNTAYFDRDYPTGEFQLGGPYASGGFEAQSTTAGAGNGTGVAYRNGTAAAGQHESASKDGELRNGLRRAEALLKPQIEGPGDPRSAPRLPHAEERDARLRGAIAIEPTWAESAAPDATPPLSLALIHNELDDAAAFAGRLRPAIDRLAAACAGRNLTVERFGAVGSEGPLVRGLSLSQRVESRCRLLVEQIVARHRQSPFDVVHCHDWTAVPAGLEVARRLGLPLVLSLHSLEHERSRSGVSTDDSDAATHWEKAGAAAAGVVVVPSAATRERLLTLYSVSADKVLVIPDVLEDLSDTAVWKRQRGLAPEAPLILFAGAISRAAGADLLLEAAIQMAADVPDASVAFVGDGPLKDALEERARDAGLGERCRFFGTLSSAALAPILMACDLVVIPARTRQDESLAQTAIAAGKPVLCTRQAELATVVDGENGLIVRADAGSLSRSMRTVLDDPLCLEMLRAPDHRRVPLTEPAQSAAAAHILAYGRALADAAAG